MILMLLTDFELSPTWLPNPAKVMNTRSVAYLGLIGDVTYLLFQLGLELSVLRLLLSESAIVNGKLFNNLTDLTQQSGKQHSR
jgi:hypothetical protein